MNAEERRNKKDEEVELLRRLEVVGNNGWFLTKLFFVCMLPSILNGLNATSYVFLTDIPQHWCHVTQLDNTSWTDEQKRIISSPSGSNESTCAMFDFDYSHLAAMTFQDALSASQASRNSSGTVPCSSHAFAEGVPSMVLDFDLVCERTALKSTVQVAIALGKFIGALLFGVVSDKYGRRTSFLCGSLLYIVSGPLVAAANSYGLVIAGRIGLGAAGSGIYHSAFVILSEIANKKRRASLGILYNMSYPIGQMIVPIVAYFVRDWRILQTIISVPAILCLLFYWLMPESPMWLLSKQRRQEAALYIEKQYSRFGGSDGVPLKQADSSGETTPPIEQEHHQPIQQPPLNAAPQNWLDAFLSKMRLTFEQLYLLVRHAELRSRIAINLVIWCVLNFSYYGLALNVDNFRINRYLYGFLTGLVEAPSYVLPLPLLRWMGRRHAAILLLYIAAAALLAILILPETTGELNIPLLIVASIGRLCVSGVFAVVILQATELYPTLLRNTAIGIGSTASHVGSMIAPLFVDLVGGYSRDLPSTVFGLLAFLAGSLMFLLPETKNKALPVSIQDVLDAPKESRVGFHQICR